jgi:hypothetical protein
MLCLSISVHWTIDLGDLVIGVGTLLLAIGTFMLARSGSKSLEALDMPFVVATPDGDDGAIALIPVGPRGKPPTDVKWTLSAELANLGAGPGILEKIDIRERESGKSVTEGAWEIDEPLEKGARKDVGIPLAGGPPSEGSLLTLDIYYRSASGRPYITNHTIKIGKNQSAKRRTFKRRNLRRLKRLRHWWHRRQHLTSVTQTAG